MKSAQYRIVEATFNLLNEKPFQNVTTEEIIKNAQVAKASFYYYFRDKYDVAVMVMKEKVFNVFLDPKSGVEWSFRIKSVIDLIVKNKEFMCNVLKIDMARILYNDLLRDYCKSIMEYVKRNGADIERLDIKRSCINISSCDLLSVYRYCKGKIKTDEMQKLADCWLNLVPNNLVPYIK